jgi:hypothetical protein
MQVVDPAGDYPASQRHQRRNRDLSVATKHGNEMTRAWKRRTVPCAMVSRCRLIFAGLLVIMAALVLSATHVLMYLPPPSPFTIQQICSYSRDLHIGPRLSSQKLISQASIHGPRQVAIATNRLATPSRGAARAGAGAGVGGAPLLPPSPAPGF